MRAWKYVTSLGYVFAGSDIENEVNKDKYIVMYVVDKVTCNVATYSMYLRAMFIAGYAKPLWSPFPVNKTNPPASVMPTSTCRIVSPSINVIIIRLG